MTFPISAALLDALVLAVVAREDTYGYRITQDIRSAVEVSESTLYYRITPKGRAMLELYREEWKLHRRKIQDILLSQGEEKNTDE